MGGGTCPTHWHQRKRRWNRTGAGRNTGGARGRWRRRRRPGEEVVAPYEPRVPHGWVNPGDKEVQVPHEWVNPGPGGAPAFFLLLCAG